MNEIVLSLITLVGAAVTAGLVQWYYSRKAQKRQMEAEALKAEAEARQSEAIAQQAARQAAIETESKTIANYEKQIEMLSGQLARMNEQIEFKDKRIEDLNADIAAKEKQYIEQTHRLREVQDREHASQLEINRLNGVIITQEQRISQLELLLKDVKCHRLTCLDREPKNSHTRQAEAEVESGAPIEQLKQTKHRKTQNRKQNEDTD